MKTTREILLRAAEIAKENWGQGYSALAAGCECAATAVGRAMYEDRRRKLVDDEPREALNVLAAHIGVPLDQTRSIFAWNDSPSRTKAQVVAALRAAAETCP